MAARREEGEYPSWIFDRRATPSPRPKIATLWAKTWRAKGGVAPQSQNTLAMLLRPAWPSARQTFAQPFPICEMGSQSTGNAAPCPTSAMRAQQMTTVRRARTLRREAVSSLRISLGQPASRFGKPRHFGILAIACRIHGRRDVPADHPELHALLISVRQVVIDRLAHGAERGRRSAGSAARYWATVVAVMLATIPGELCGGQASCTAPPLCLSSRRCWTAAVVLSSAMVDS